MLPVDVLVAVQPCARSAWPAEMPPMPENESCSQLCAIVAEFKLRSHLHHATIALSTAAHVMIQSANRVGFPPEVVLCEHVTDAPLIDEQEDGMASTRRRKLRKLRMKKANHGKRPLAGK